VLAIAGWRRSRNTSIVFAVDLAGAIAQAGIVPTLEPRPLQDAIRASIATRRGYFDWTVDHAGWVVTLYHPDQQEFSGRTLEEALAWCLVWLMVNENGVNQIAI
jgi:hypothetical protein